ncbi:MFS transporter [Nonomuraea dietziae]|uniref:MFS transporter n=1 Tax=Nonomuraea dietziae TaxID=65515 RepID=UPI0031D0BF1F
MLFLALPPLAETLRPSGTQTLWIMDVYGFMMAGFLVTMGTLGDRIGRRRLLMIGAVGVGVTSLLAAYSTSAEMLIVSRALLGVAAATLMPSTLALISNMFQDPGQRGRAIALWAGCFMAGTALGPVVGGVLLEFFWWGSVFLLGVPVMLVLLVTAPFLLPEYRDPTAGRLDLFSVALSLAAVLPFVYGLKEITRYWLAAAADPDRAGRAGRRRGVRGQAARAGPSGAGRPPVPLPRLHRLAADLHAHHGRHVGQLPVRHRLPPDGRRALPRAGPACGWCRRRSPPSSRRSWRHPGQALLDGDGHRRGTGRRGGRLRGDRLRRSRRRAAVAGHRIRGQLLRHRPHRGAGHPPGGQLGPSRAGRVGGLAAGDQRPPRCRGRHRRPRQPRRRRLPREGRHPAGASFDAARDNLEGALALAGLLPAEVLAAARAAYTSGLNTVAVVCAVFAAAAALVAITALRRVGAGGVALERERPLEPSGAVRRGSAG